MGAVPGERLLVKLAGGLELSQLFIVLGQEIGDLEIVRILLMGQFHFLEAQLGLPHQLVIVRIALQPGDFLGRLTHVGKQRAGGLFYPGVARPRTGAANHSQRPGSPKGQHRQTGQPISARGPAAGRSRQSRPGPGPASTAGAVSPSPHGCTRFLLSPINHGVLPLCRISGPLGPPGLAASAVHCCFI